MKGRPFKNKEIMKHHGRSPFRWSVAGKNMFKIFPIIYFWWLRFDCFIVRYDEGDANPPHIDTPHYGHEMYRFNFVFWQAEEGGIYKGHSVFNVGQRLFLIRPDLHEHEVTKVTKGVRYMFSVGLFI